MSLKIIPVILENKYFTFNALAFLPSLDDDAPSIKSEWCVFSHGYTASKSDCLTWATRVSEAGSPAIIFDHPGHYLGGINSVNSFEEFTEHAHKNFALAFQKLQELMQGHAPDSGLKTIVLGGHSLGALLCLKALNLPELAKFETLAIGVGIGIGQHKAVHLFESSFYQKTLNVRRQLVSPALDSSLMFPWIKDEKLKLNLYQKRIHLITGLDDLVVGKGGLEALRFELSAQNIVTTFEPNKLQHHNPSGAATYIYSFLKKEFDWQ